MRCSYPRGRETEGNFNSQKGKRKREETGSIRCTQSREERKKERRGEERGIPGEYQFKTTFRRIPRIAYTYAVLFVIPFHEPLGPGCCFIISFLPCAPLSLPRRRPICLCAHRYYACCIMHCAARWTYARMRAPTPLPSKIRRREGARCTSSRCIWRVGRATIREMLKDLTGLDYAIVSSGGIRLSFLSIFSFRRSRREDIKVEIFSKEKLYEVKYSIIDASILFLFSQQIREGF